MNDLPLLGVATVVVGFVLRLNPVIVVVSAAIVTGIAAQFGIVQFLSVLGEAFVRNRVLLLWVFTLPIIGLLEREGLRERAQSWIRSLRGMTPGRLLIAYHLLRQFTAALGLISLGGHPQTVRPLVAPMAEAAAESVSPSLDAPERERIRALAAGTDNVALFFGEDIFIAFGAVLLIQSFLKNNGIDLDPLHIALWGLPTAIAAFVIHAWRLRRLDARLRRDRSRGGSVLSDDSRRREASALPGGPDTFAPSPNRARSNALDDEHGPH